MEDSEKGNLINNDSNEKKNTLNNEEEIKRNNKTKNKIILITLIILFLITFILILIFIVFKNAPNSDTNHKEINYPPNEIDTIPKEEMDKARNAFKQYQYNVTYNNINYTLDYNLFKPENYSINKKYPLIIFIEDASLVGPNKVKNPLDNTIGGPIWATDREQKKHECFILVPQYNEVIIVNKTGKLSFNEYLNITIKLTRKLIEDFSINQDKVYCTGQSMGAMTSLYLLANYQNIFAAGLIVDGQWKLQELSGLVNSKFTYIVAGGDEKAFQGQTEVKNYFDSLNISYGILTEINAQENVEILNNISQSTYNSNFNYNFITYKNGTVFPQDAKKTM